MALNLPDFGTWLLRSVWRDNFPKGPVSVIERLNAVRPLRDADKDALLGAVLSLGPSLQLALQMLLELLPEDESRERLGEVLCPTLGQLHRTLTDTLLSFEPRGRDAPTQSDKCRPEPAPSDFLQTPKPAISKRPRTPQRPSTSRDPGSAISRAREVSHHLDSAPSNIRSGPVWMPAERSLTVDTASAGALARQDTFTSGFQDRSRDPAADLALVKELRAEMRVNAAIQVAVDSLEFAEGQLKIVKEVNRLSGGSFELLQRHFYEGYNRILFRALELERREFDSPPYAASLADGAAAVEMESEPQLSVTFESPVALPPLPPLSPSQSRSPARRGPERRPLPIRRNTTQGISERDAKSLGQKLKAKRRLSLAEELALACDGDSESESGGSSSESGDEERELLNGARSRAQSDSESENSQEESESDDSEEEDAGKSEPQTGGSESEDSSSDEDGNGDEDERPSAHPPTRIILDAKDGASARVLKRLETRVDVISPPTSPERPVGMVMSPEKSIAKS